MDKRIVMEQIDYIDVWHSNEMEDDPNTSDSWHTLVIFNVPVRIDGVNTYSICSCDVPIKKG